tara:strand:- start:591 stop:1676 length:1086 start_codon:yes stop_codon:yes gene_type:complete
MIIFKTYQKYLIKKFYYNIFKISFIFLVLGFIMGILEELKFFSDVDVGYYIPLLLIFLNLPHLIYQIFPFIILLSIMFLFIDLNDKNELIAFKNNGLDNFKILKLLALTSLFTGIFMVLIFYNVAAVLKFNYLNIKKDFTKDNKYLASITENGLWIKDENESNIIFVNAEKIDKKYLIDVNLTILSKEFEYQKTIVSPLIDISNNLWILKNATILNSDNTDKFNEEIQLITNFNYDKINNLYSDLTSLTIWQLKKIKKDYISINYSTVDIDYQLQKVYSFPIYLLIISIFSVVFMMNINQQRSRTAILTLGIFFSVIIYYLNNFFGVIGKNEKIPLIASIWIPLLILFLISSIGIIRINEK